MALVLRFVTRFAHFILSVPCMRTACTVLSLRALRALTSLCILQVLGWLGVLLAVVVNLLDLELRHLVL
jgi:hypothetical protein